MCLPRIICFFFRLFFLPGIDYVSIGESRSYSLKTGVVVVYNRCILYPPVLQGNFTDISTGQMFARIGFRGQFHHPQTRRQKIMVLIFCITTIMSRVTIFGVVQPDQINIALFFWYLVKSDLSCVGVSHF